MHGCSDCRYCKCYSGDYWTPDDFECQVEDFGDVTAEELDTIFTRIWENGEEWKDDEEPICPAWAEVNYNPEEEYWDRYAWEENHYDKDEVD